MLPKPIWIHHEHGNNENKKQHTHSLSICFNRFRQEFINHSRVSCSVNNFSFQIDVCSYHTRFIWIKRWLRREIKVETPGVPKSPYFNESSAVWMHIIWEEELFSNNEIQTVISRLTFWFVRTHEECNCHHKYSKTFCQTTAMTLKHP